jgi:hypothetical protein
VGLAGLFLVVEMIRHGELQDLLVLGNLLVSMGGFGMRLASVLERARSVPKVLLTSETRPSGGACRTQPGRGTLP